MASTTNFFKGEIGEEGKIGGLGGYRARAAFLSSCLLLDTENQLNKKSDLMFFVTFAR